MSGTALRDERLPCGARLAELVEQATDDAATDTAHQAGCLQCRAVLDRLRAIDGLLARLADEPVRLPDRLVRSVMRRVRGSVAAGWLTVARTGRGATIVSGQALVAVIEWVGRDIPGTHHLRATPRRALDRRGRPDPDAPAVVDVDLVGQYPEPLPAVAAAVRYTVRELLEDLAGLDVDVDVAVTDVNARDE